MSVSTRLFLSSFNGAETRRGVGERRERASTYHVRPVRGERPHEFISWNDAEQAVDGVVRNVHSYETRARMRLVYVGVRRFPFISLLNEQQYTGKPKPSELLWQTLLVLKGEHNVFCSKHKRACQHGTLSNSPRTVRHPVRSNAEFRCGYKHQLTFPSARHFQPAVEIVYETLRRQPSPSRRRSLPDISIPISNCARRRCLSAIRPTSQLRLSSYLLSILLIDLAIAGGGGFGCPQAVCAILCSKDEDNVVVPNDHGIVQLLVPKGDLGCMSQIRIKAKGL